MILNLYASSCFLHIYIIFLYVSHNILQLTKGPVLESEPYKANVDKILSLLKQASTLRVAIIEIFMTEDDTTYGGQSTMSLFIEKIQHFVTTSIQVIIVSSLILISHFVSTI